MQLYHYFEKERGPFLTLSDLSHEESVRVHRVLETEGGIFLARGANGEYMAQRRIVEQRAHAMFLRKGGKPQRKHPYYMILAEDELEECQKWFRHVGIIKIPLEEFDPSVISFTYGDSFPIFRPIFDEEPEYPLYLSSEIFEVIKQRGMPPVRNDTMSWLEPTYIEAQIWSDQTISRYW